MVWSVGFRGRDKEIKIRLEAYQFSDDEGRVLVGENPEGDVVEKKYDKVDNALKDYVKYRDKEYEVVELEISTVTKKGINVKVRIYNGGIHIIANVDPSVVSREMAEKLEKIRKILLEST